MLHLLNNNYKPTLNHWVIIIFKGQIISNFSIKKLLNLYYGCC